MTRRFWAFQTNPTDFQRALEWADGDGGNAAVEPFGWTAPLKASPGDLFVLYGHKPICEYAGVGRLCSQPVLSARDGNHWSHVQMVRCPRPLSLADAKADPAICRWPRLRMMIGSHLEITDAAVWRGFMTRLVDPFPDVRATVADWRNGAAMPGLCEPLDDAVRATPNHNRSGTTNERVLQEEIWDAYIENGWARDIEPEDDVDLDDTFHLPGAGFADIVLVDLESNKPTLLLVEVKRDATPGPHTDGTTQLLDYEPALRRLAPGWRIKKVLIALCYSHEVLILARKRGIECWHYDPETEEFLEP
jgi:hypothetical protein